MFVTNFDLALNSEKEVKIETGGYYKGTIISARYNKSEVNSGESLEIDLKDDSGRVAKSFLSLKTKDGSEKDKNGKELYTLVFVHSLLSLLGISQTENFYELKNQKIGFKIQIEQKLWNDKIINNFIIHGFYDYETNKNYKEFANNLEAEAYLVKCPKDIILETKEDLPF